MFGNPISSENVTTVPVGRIINLTVLDGSVAEFEVLSYTNITPITKRKRKKIALQLVDFFFKKYNDVIICRQV